MLSLVIALQEGVWLKQFDREKSVFKSDKSIKKTPWMGFSKVSETSQILQHLYNLFCLVSFTQKSVHRGITDRFTFIKAELLDLLYHDDHDHIIYCISWKTLVF